MDCIYILHFDNSLSHANHYVGSSSNLDQRTRSHAKGEGARLTQYLKEIGEGWTLVAAYAKKPQATMSIKQIERTVKNGKNSTRHCPICSKGQHVAPKWCLEIPITKLHSTELLNA